ncbi:MAG: hypothetical protein WCE68_00600 [Anaerolineales bacterium]
MQKTNFLPEVTLLFLCLALSLSGCQGSKTMPTLTPDAALAWQIQVTKFEIKNSLSGIKTVTGYNGSKTDQVLMQSPDAGDVYLIMNVSINKNNIQSATPFDWQWLVVQDASGNTYHRLANDAFLEQYAAYTPRITGLELRLGQYTGWLGYEIPASAAKGELTLAYTAEGSQQEIVLQK